MGGLSSADAPATTSSDRRKHDALRDSLRESLRGLESSVASLREAQA